MIFSSQIFIFTFLPLVLLLYYIVPKKFRNYILLSASLAFYSWASFKSLPILLLSIVSNYVVGVLIDKYHSNIKIARLFLAVGIGFNILLLGYFKYFNFFVDNLNKLLNSKISVLTIVLPIGISFFTFQSISYLMDIYRGDAKVNKNIFTTALYISFFPQVVSGPIIKYKDIQLQLQERKESIEKFSYGIQRFIIGLAKKVIIADALGGVAQNIFSELSFGIDLPTAWIGAIAYTFQLFFDFSGYSDMAIGIASFFGFKYMENFNYPYISKSISEFWRRWHISLSTWFKEYLYIPLGGNRRGNVYINLFIVFLVTGVWHGASWNFIVWGLWNGFFILLERLISKSKYYNRIPQFIKWIFTILIIMIGWVLFNSNGLSAALQYLSIMFGIVKMKDITFSYPYFVNYKLIFLFIISAILSTPVLKNFFEKYKNRLAFEILKTIGLVLLFILGIIYITNSNYSPFIYFQF
jgi:alginate O-acetyltransferase complex protein AlgI